VCEYYLFSFLFFIFAAATAGPVEELEDGCKLLRKSDDDDYVSCSVKHSNRKQRRSRKASMVGKISCSSC
jgi:hypothetical protein